MAVAVGANGEVNTGKKGKTAEPETGKAVKKNGGKK